ncbi:MAG: outer membrane protein assembly factor BamD [Gemmatimonadota bacterium]|jgi:outer membrane protein assembly factor BamD|nr:outer membrane protein assembly factor BamD [Gemmatimonadota bacterium]
MTMLSIRRALLGALLFLPLAGCGSRQVPLAQLGPDVLFERARVAHEAGRHGRAAELLDAFLQNHLGDPRVSDARMMLGRSQMERGEYLEAAGAFQRLVTDYPADPRAAEARFLTCEAYSRLSPRAPRDQEYTRVAITHCESVRSLYPQTEFATRAAAQVTELRHKLAQKAYETGVFYFRRRAYDAAVVYLADAVDQYPETSVAPTALMMLVESYGRIGYAEEAEEARQRLRRDYPESAEARALPG